MTRQTSTVIVLLLTCGLAATASAQPASRLSTYELTGRKSVALSGYAVGNWDIKNDTTMVCNNVAVPAGGVLTMDTANGATHCADFFDALKAPPAAFAAGKIKAVDSAGGIVVLKLVDPESKLTVDQLIADQIDLDGWVPGDWSFTSDGADLCGAKIKVTDDRKLTLKSTTCAGLFKLSRGGITKASVKAVLDQAAPPYDVPIRVFDPPAGTGTVTWTSLDALPATGLHYFDPGQKKWTAATRDELRARQATLGGQQLDVYGTDNGKTAKWSLDKAALGPPPGSDQTDYAAACRTIAKANATSNVLCFRFDGSWHLLLGPTRGAIMRPNTPVLAVAYVPEGKRVAFDLAGEQGLVVPAFDESVRGNAHSTMGGAQLAEARQLFAPPLPGVHALTLAMADDAALKIVTQLTVDTAYAGAIRIGVAGVFGGARDRAFAASTLPGSGQAEITTTEGGDMDAELVLGAAAFFEPGGRTYFAATPRRWAPYFGIGLLNQSATGLQLLKSVHLGFEYEVSRNFSIAATIVGRRVTRLADGLEVGDPINGTTVPTRTGYELGVGLVVNVSPEFLKLAKTPGTGFFQ